LADLRTLTLSLVADVDKFKKGLNKADNETRSFSDKLKTALKAGAVAFAAIGAAAGAFAIKIGKEAINAASDFNEELQKSEVILGDGAAAVAKFASTAASKLGQSRTEALRAAGNFAIFGKSAGLSGQALSKFSTDFVTLASDLASFNNTSPEDAVQALGAALRGESEPIRRYGVLLNEATLKNRALELGIIDNIKNALTPQQKVLAAQAEIFAQTSDAQGDFARTSDGLANSQRILKAEIENLKISLGESLLPAALSVSKFFKEQFVPVLKGVVDSITGKPNSLTTAIEEGRRRLSGFEAQQFLAERQGNRLGESYKALGKSVADFANIFRTEASAEGGFNTGLEVLTAINNQIAKFIDSITIAIRKVIEFRDLLTNALTNAGIVNQTAGNPFGVIQSQTPSRVPNTALFDKVNNQSITVNVRGAVDQQGTARTLTKVLTTQKKITGVGTLDSAARRALK
jgi:hypothetical protein